MLVILGNQLFPLDLLPGPGSMPVFMAEDLGLCTYEKHHQQKLVLFLAAMRAYADELRDAGYELHYVTLDTADERSYEDKLADVMQSCDTERLAHFEIEDKPMERRLVRFADEKGLDREELTSPMFTCSRERFAEFAEGKSRLLMAEFYKQQRKRLGILVDDDGAPAGGQWSFDADNRKKLPRNVEPPPAPTTSRSAHVEDVVEVVKREFADHPGDADDFCWPTTHSEARTWLENFIDERLEQFGPYEDAMTTRSATVFHSLLSPCLNLGLLTPGEVIERVLERADDAPLQSVEGIRARCVPGIRRPAGGRQLLVARAWAYGRMVRGHDGHRAA